MTGRKKIWVKRPGASATLVHIQEDDLVDDVRDMILKKYANSLGRLFDAPDVTLKVLFKEQEKILKPDEPISQVMRTCFPSGQGMNDALVINIPQKSEIKPSPQPIRNHETRPTESGTEYFPPMPSPRSLHIMPTTVTGQNQHMSTTAYAHSMSVITTGHVPPLPSPSSITSRIYHREQRALRQNSSTPSTNVGATHSSSTPSIFSAPQTRSRNQSNASEKPSVVTTLAKIASPAPSAPLISTPPTVQPTKESIQSKSVVSPPRDASPRLSRNRRFRKAIGDNSRLRIGTLSGGVPPINVLIVEDNNINLKLLEAFMKRLKVRWQTAVNGKIAVDKWKSGGFHLVLMDIQLPVMNGLQATREIRRLERMNGIGVFSSSGSSTAPQETIEEPQGEDILSCNALFKSPVIIVALTASSLQSDRHEALAAGCNDFLTKVCYIFISNIPKSIIESGNLKKIYWTPKVPNLSNSQLITKKFILFKF